MGEVRIDGDRLWLRLMEMGKIGATPRGGCNRQALTDEDRAGRELFIGWCEASGYAVRIDRVGNIFARRPGQQPDAPVVLTGSHLDTQPTGGKFDGVYGVLAGLEVLQTLDDHRVKTNHPMEVAVWTNEEGVRFDGGMTGSAVFAGALDLEDAYAITDRNGATLRGELERIGMLGSTPAAPTAIKAAFEAHIEQGPVLEGAGKTIGIVTGVQHMSRHQIVVHGQEAHAGTTPASARKDPVLALAAFLPRLYALREGHGADSRLTFGFLYARPGSPNTVPGRLEVSVDLRHPITASHDEMLAALRAIVRDSCDELGLEGAVHSFWEAPSVDFAEPCLESLRSAVRTLGYPGMEMISGAGHDACNLAALAPTAMLFVPSQDGLSHNEQEHTSPELIEAGTNVLLLAMLDQAESARGG